VTPFRQPIRPDDVGADVWAYKRAYLRMGVKGARALGKTKRAGAAFVACTKTVQRNHGLTGDGIAGEATHRVVAPHLDAYGAMLYRSAKIRRPKPTYIVVHGCPVPAQFAPYVRTLLAESGASLISAYRGADAEALLHQLGKRSQAELYWAWEHRQPGANPANRPGRSTHELCNDGYAYPGRAGAKLAWWQCGLDLDDAHVEAFIRAATRHGWRVSRTYPHQGSEYHHVNFRSPPLGIRIRAALSRSIGR
jgi:hypothetical protein